MSQAYPNRTPNCSHMGDDEFRRGYESGLDAFTHGTTDLNMSGTLAAFIGDALGENGDDYDRGYALGFANAMARNLKARMENR